MTLPPCDRADGNPYPRSDCYSRVFGRRLMMVGLPGFAFWLPSARRLGDHQTRRPAATIGSRRRCFEWPPVYTISSVPPTRQQNPAPENSRICLGSTSRTLFGKKKPRGCATCKNTAKTLGTREHATAEGLMYPVPDNLRHIYLSGGSRICETSHFLIFGIYRSSASGLFIRELIPFSAPEAVARCNPRLEDS